MREEIKSPRRAFYFGFGQGGHHLWFPDHSYSFDPQKNIPGFPWTYNLLDTTLLRNGRHPDACDGRVWWTCGGKPTLWLAFYWWDRSGDSRPGSNSGFYVQGFDLSQRQEALEYAGTIFPEVIARQRFPLVLQP